MGHSCHNHEPRTECRQTIEVQTGWTPDGRRQTRTHSVAYNLIQCGHGDDPRRDTSCQGCRWIDWTKEEVSDE